ncbi:hypothetical protein FRC04_004062 [Tulasnella sp. 424]|nr:hypothetical protein FRC04_004062 [Tulasnella sp. 424]KAG8964494.1 hypothetical protein FRC05_003775 [Tulasnella sp. 425]
MNEFIPIESFIKTEQESTRKEEDLIFTGGSAEEAEDFIFAVKKRAYSKGKHKDPAWIAEFVSICFAKKALRWYERLDEDTQNDWRLLKRALLDEYEGSIPSSVVPTSAPSLQSSVLTTAPAAAPPTTKTGRIRVDSEFDHLRGYIGRTFINDTWCTISPDKGSAPIFDFDISACTIKFQAGHDGSRSVCLSRTCVTKGTADEYLMVQAHQNPLDLRAGSNQKSKGRPEDAMSVGWSNNKVDLWSAANEGKLEARWQLATGGALYGMLKPVFGDYTHALAVQDSGSSTPQH